MSSQSFPSLESLEDRIAPATLVVTNANDDMSPGSLRAVVADANLTPDSDTIVFDKTVFNAAAPQKITLTMGDIVINNPLVIKGPGRDILTVDGNDSSRIFDITDGTSAAVPVSLSGFTVSNGNSNGGGGVRSEEPLTLSNMVFLSNTSTGQGGALHVSGPGPLTIQKSVFTGNEAGTEGGGIYADVAGSIKVSATTISQNTSTNSGGGAKLQVNSAASPKAVLEVVSSTISGNSGDYGGGLYIENDADGNKGKMFVKTTKITGNTAVAWAGGLYLDDGTTVIEKSVISGNRATDAGGIYDQFTNGLTIKGSQVFENRATSGNGGGILISNQKTVSISGTSITGNSAGGDGGGLLLDAATTFVMKGGVLSGNSAGGDGGAVKIKPVSGSLTIDGTRLEGNSAGDDGGGIQLEGSSTSLQLKKAVFTGNRALDGGGLAISDQAGIVSTGSSFIGNLSTNSTYGGGAILANNPGAVTISGNIFDSNRTAGTGGAIDLFAATTSPVSITKSRFTGNVSAGFAGAAYLSADTQMTLDGNAFSGNSGSNGGAIVLAGAGAKSLTKNTMTGNSATGTGGAIAINFGAGQTTLSGGSITDNVAAGSHGAIRNFSVLSVDIIGTVIAANSAPNSPNT